MADGKPRRMRCGLPRSLKAMLRVNRRSEGRQGVLLRFAVPNPPLPLNRLGLLIPSHGPGQRLNVRPAASCRSPPPPGKAGKSPLLAVPPGCRCPHCESSAHVNKRPKLESKLGGMLSRNWVFEARSRGKAVMAISRVDNCRSPIDRKFAIPASVEVPDCGRSLMA